MAQTANAEPSERFCALTAVILIHIAAFAILLNHRWPPVPASPEAGSLSVVMLSDQPAAPPAPPPTPILPAKIRELIKTAEQPAATTQSIASASGTPGPSCVTLELVRKAILADPAAVESVLNSPPETRSIAEAVVLWNAQWSQSANSLAAPLGATRAAVERGLATLDEPCLDEPITGPRLVPVPAGEGTMFVVFGSGIWTWRQVTAEVPLPTVATEELADFGLKPRTTLQARN